MNAGTVRWMSPELINPEQFGFRHRRQTKESDCYALGMATYEVLSDGAPFRHHVDLIVMQKVVNGERPGRPRGMRGAWFTSDLWEMLELCWVMQPGSRPNIKVVLECFVQVSRTWKPPSSRADEDSGEIWEGVEVGDGVEVDEDVDSDEDTDTDEDTEMDVDVETSGFLSRDVG